MTKFHGALGFGITEETAQDVYQEVVRERPSRGDLKRDSLSFDTAQQVNADLTMGNLISIVADAYVSEHYSLIRYVRWQGVRWKVVNISVEPPRLVLRLGGVYNGPEPTADA